MLNHDNKCRKVQGSFASQRSSVLDYAREKYGSEPDYPWVKLPDYAVLRHNISRKWYGLIMNIQRSKLGLVDDSLVDILNVKCDGVMIGGFLQEAGFLPAYHMNKGSWLTVLLDGTVAEERLFFLLDLSYELTSGRKRR